MDSWDYSQPDNIFHFMAKFGAIGEQPTVELVTPKGAQRLVESCEKIRCRELTLNHTDPIMMLYTKKYHVRSGISLLLKT